MLKNSKDLKDIKPVNEPVSVVNNKINGQTIVINTIITIVICFIFLSGNYFLQNSLLSQKLSTIASQDEHGDDFEDSSTDELSKGIVYDLGEFTMNLSDTQARRYLKVEVSIELSQNERDKALSSKGSSSSGHSTSSGVDVMKHFEEEMNQYKPAIRDAVINSLSSKTSDELSTVTGKEIAKEQISSAVDAILNGEREVIRVSFGQFIMQ